MLQEILILFQLIQVTKSQDFFATHSNLIRIKPLYTKKLENLHFSTVYQNAQIFKPDFHFKNYSFRCFKTSPFKTPFQNEKSASNFFEGPNFSHEIFNSEDHFDLETPFFVNEIPLKTFLSVKGKKIFYIFQYKNENVTVSINKYLKKLKRKFNKMCYSLIDEKDTIKICPFDKIETAEQTFTFSKEFSAKDDILILENIEGLIFRQKFNAFPSIFFKMAQKNYSKLNTVYQLFLLCGDEENVFKSVQQTNIFYLKSRKVCGIMKKRKSIVFDQKDPKGAVKLLENLKYSDCQSFAASKTYFTFCFDKYLVEEKNKNSENSENFKNGENKGEKTTFLLGDFEGIKNTKMVRINGDNNSSFLSRRSKNGDFCQIKNGKKIFFSTKLVLICYHGITYNRPFKILSIDQMKRCNFVITIGIPRLCQHPFFADQIDPEKAICLYHEKVLD